MESSPASHSGFRARFQPVVKISKANTITITHFLMPHLQAPVFVALPLDAYRDQSRSDLEEDPQPFFNSAMAFSKPSLSFSQAGPLAALRSLSFC